MANNPRAAFKPYRLRCTLFPSDMDAYKVKFSPDGLLLAVASEATTRTYRIATPLPTLDNVFYGHLRGVTDLDFSYDGRLLATSSFDSTIRLWDVSTASPVKTLHGHTAGVLCLKMNPQSNKIASGSWDESIRIWDVNSGACQDVLVPSSGLISSLDFNRDGSMIVSGGRDGPITIWDAATGRALTTFRPRVRLPVGSVKFSVSGKRILVGTFDNSLKIFDMERYRLLTFRGHVNSTCSIASTFLGQRDEYIVSGSEDNCIYFWESNSGRIIQKLSAHEKCVISISCHPTRKLIASASLSASTSQSNLETVKIWTQED